MYTLEDSVTVSIMEAGLASPSRNDLSNAWGRIELRSVPYERTSFKISYISLAAFCVDGGT